MPCAGLCLPQSRCAAIRRTPAYVGIPADTIRMMGKKASVGVVSHDNRVSFRPVTIAESDGKVARLSLGLRVGERVILNPGESISDQEQVQPIDTSSK